MSQNQERLARKALEPYPYRPIKIKLIKGGGRKLVWMVQTKNGIICLKRLHHPVDMALFSHAAQKYAKKKGARVPAVLLTKKGQLFHEMDGWVYAAYEWIPGSYNPDFHKPQELKETIRGLAKFHVATKGYTPPKGAMFKSEIDRSLNQYKLMHNQLVEMDNMAKSGKFDKTFSKLYRKHFDKAMAQMKRCLSILENVNYPKLVEKIKNEKWLCHLDFGPPNALMSRGKGYVIDIDGVAYDLPVLELSHLLIKISRDYNRWSPDLIKTPIRWYEAKNPLGSEQKQILRADLEAPKTFHNVAKAYFYKGSKISPMKLERAIRTDSDRQKALRAVFG